MEKQGKTKLSVITNQLGQIVGTFQPTVQGGMESGVIPEPGQSIQEVELPAEHLKLDVHDLHAKISALLPKRYGSRP